MKNSFELDRIIDTYINLQIKKPLSIDKKEKKVYTKAEFNFFRENGLNYFNCLIKYSESLINMPSEFGPKIYSRTEFFSMCFYEIAKYSSIEEIKNEVDIIKLKYSDSEKYGYAKMAIDTLAYNTIKLKEHETKKEEIKKTLKKVMKLRH